MHQISQHETIPSQIGADQTLIYLVRHGQTTWNIERRFQGQLDVPLSEEGMRQAEAVAAWLGNQPIPFGAIYTSDLLRAKQTAEAIGKRLGLEPEPVRDLREIHVGDWQGMLSTEIESRYPGQLERWRNESHLFRIPGGETVQEVQARMLAWYAEAIRARRGQAIVVVSHGMSLKGLLAALSGWELGDERIVKSGHIGNTGVNVMLADHVSAHSTTLLLNSLLHLNGSSELAAIPGKPGDPPSA